MNSDTKSTIATVACVIVISAIAGWFHFQKSLQALNPIEEVATGATMPALAGYKWKSSSRTLVLALKIGCPHCDNEMEFYERLSKLSENHSIQAKILAVLPDSAGEVSRAFSNRLLAIQKLSSADFRNIRITETPTLMLVDAAGAVKAVWFGELRPEEKREVLDAIGYNSKN